MAFSQEQLSALTQFMKSNPSPDQIFQAAQQQGLSADQLAQAMSQAGLATYQDAMQGLNSYSQQTGKQLGGAAQTYPNAPAAAPATQSTYQPTKWSTDELNASREFFRNNPTPQQMAAKAQDAGLSSTQLADLYSQATGNDYQGALGAINNYQQQTGTTLTGGYLPGNVSAPTGQAGAPTPTGTAQPSSVPPNMTGMQGTGTVNMKPGYVTGLAQDFGNFAGGVLNQVQDVYKNWYDNPLTTGVTPELQEYYKQASTPNQNWTNMVQQAGQQSLAGAQYDPNKLNQFMNPYLTTATDNIYSAANRNLTENLMPAVNSTFTGAGQFGSTRNADFMNRALRDTQEGASKAVGALQLGAYGQAQDDYQKWAQLGQAGAGQAGQLATVGSNLDQRNLTNLGTAATGQQQLEQQTLDTGYQDWLKRQSYPLGALQQTGSALGNLSNAAPSSTFNSQGIENPAQPSNMNQWLTGLQYLTGNSGMNNIYNVLNAIPTSGG